MNIHTGGPHMEKTLRDVISENQVYLGVQLSDVQLFDKYSGRGRNGSHLPPPAQIRTCRITAYGSCLGF